MIGQQDWQGRNDGPVAGITTAGRSSALVFAVVRAVAEPNAKPMGMKGARRWVGRWEHR